MVDVNLRQFVIDDLKPLLPTTWRLVPYGTQLDVLSSPAVLLQLDSVSRSPELPNSYRNVTYTLTVVTPMSIPGKADDALDDNLIDLLNAIDELPNINWTGAKRVLFGDNPAYDITLEIPIRKDSE